MSGDVQPRKRKDKKRKKDELGIEEPRGTAAALGDGDVFMHSQHEHGTGGHWCAKIIFFSLLAILISLIGLIILENRGLSELEANSVESRYSGVLEGWLEDAPDDDHHDDHTLELNHDDDEIHNEDVYLMNENQDDEHGSNEDENGLNSNENQDSNEEDEENYEGEQDTNEDDEQDTDEDEEQDTDEHEEQDTDEDEEQDINEDNEQESNNEYYQNDNHENEDSGEDEPNDNNLYNENNDDDDPNEYNRLSNYESQEDQHFNQDQSDEDISTEDNDGGEEETDELEFNEQVDENNYNSYIIDKHNEIDEDDADSNELDNESINDDNEYQNNYEEEDEHEEEDENDQEVELEKLEKEGLDEEHEPISVELPALPEDGDDNKDEDTTDDKDEDKDDDNDDDNDSGIDNEDEDEEFLEADDGDEPPVERITVPAGKPFVEVEEDMTSEQPPDTLEEEEEYEKRQEELRREEAQASHMWLKLSVGGALLVATHAVMRRATHARADISETEDASREETPISDRRMTLIPEEPSLQARKVEEVSRSITKQQLHEKIAPIQKSLPVKRLENEDEDERVSEDEEEITVEKKDAEDKELFSDEDEPDEEDEEEVVEKKEPPRQNPPVAKQPEPESEPEEEPEDDPDVEIIGDEQLEEELEEEEDEEEISDVDDAELLSRLEAKYGRLPEPERPGQKHKDGGNSVDDLWPGEPSDAYWRRQLDSAERELRQGSWEAALRIAGQPELVSSARARLVTAKALDLAAEVRRDNRLLSQAIQAYLNLIKLNERLSDKQLLQVTGRTLDRIQFRGNYLNAEPVYRLLIRRFPNEPQYRNNLTVAFLMANRVDLAEESLKETLKRWPKDRVALAHYGFVLKTRHNKYEEAVEAFREALEGDTGPANEARFYYHYGDSLLLLGRLVEAHEVHKRGAKLGHFLSPSQRSLYNVPRLKSTPWWDVERTPYARLARELEKSWRDILKEGQAANALYEQEKEGLKERGDWSQLDLFVRGREIPGRCERAPVTCGVVKREVGAAGCRRGQVKFSAMAAGTHVRAHVGPTNCRLRMHLGLSNTKDTYIRVDQEIRQWRTGKVLMFDDSFEHEVWHNGTGSRLVLIVDVWHPDLTALERRQLPAI